eukprot:1152821-Pelagomonas_calceolata.AAC.1
MCCISIVGGATGSATALRKLSSMHVCCNAVKSMCSTTHFHEMKRWRASEVDNFPPDSRRFRRAH